MTVEKPIVVLDQEALGTAVRALVKMEPRFAPVVKLHGVPSLRASDGGLQALLQMVTEQFLSLSAAAAIWARVRQRIGDVDAVTVLACPQEELMALGLSRAKAKSFHGLAQSVVDRVLDFDALPEMTNEQAHKALVALPGIGPWTADIYLLSSMLRADVWPWGDVALQAAAQHLFKLRARPDKKKMIAIGEKLRPHRATAARLLWAHYRTVKNMAQAK
jgi:DNA-3-methyladenine glycosylase II